MSRTPGIKTVSFSLPGTPLNPSRPAAMSPTHSHLPSSLTTTTICSSPTQTHEEHGPMTLSPATHGIKNTPKMLHPSKIKKQVESSNASDFKNSPTSQRPPSRPSSEVAKINPKSKKPSVPSYVRLAHSSSAGSSRDRSPLLDHDKERIASPASVAKDLRCKTNSISYKHAKSTKCDVSQLQEQLLKVEDEIKNLNRGKSTLELSVQDVRKALSINQQSISTQQKKSSRGEEDASIKLLREESRVLSRCKRNIEQYLPVVKTHLQVLDTTRRNIKTTISSLSSSLDFDAQNFKVYHGPKAVYATHVSRQRHYASGYTSQSPGGEAGKLCLVATEVVSASKNIRAEIKSKVISVQTSKTEAHKKTTDTIAANMLEAKAKKRDMLLERGQVRMVQNSTLHRVHEEEIALGMALGPVSGKHRSVSEKTERPLSRVRPDSATEEIENFKQTKQKLTRQLSASSERASHVSSTDRRLAHQLREGSQAVFLDSQTLRVRRMSLDNRWVQ